MMHIGDVYIHVCTEELIVITHVDDDLYRFCYTTLNEYITMNTNIQTTYISMSDEYFHSRYKCLDADNEHSTQALLL